MKSQWKSIERREGKLDISHYLRRRSIGDVVKRSAFEDVDSAEGR